MEFDSKHICLNWTKSSIECYRRGCNCNGCLIGELLETPCRMKQSVFELVRKFGSPPEDDNGLNQSEQKVIDAILNGANSIDDIASDTELKRESVKNILSNLYPLAETDGVSYRSLRYKLSQFIDWVRGAYEL